ncbi:hypothetical protein [uncultured Deinococcus sp.]|uniref:hypothetical protein n=1 Tax=uncultured Deinococcus sp. TaxID=158789 RepID=UPI0025CC5018|nr:hypothetical protein [uncultured Deinococcus sp.]
MNHLLAGQGLRQHVHDIPEPLTALGGQEPDELDEALGVVEDCFEQENRTSLRSRMACSSMTSSSIRA